jgi:hypothetical protein
MAKAFSLFLASNLNVANHDAKLAVSIFCVQLHVKYSTVKVLWHFQGLNVSYLIPNVVSSVHKDLDSVPVSMKLVTQASGVR